MIEVSETCCPCNYIKHILAQPNTHLIVVLYVRPVPLNVHAFTVSNLVFGASHRPLKSVILECTSPSIHQSAVYQLLANNWFSQIYFSRKLDLASDGSVAKFAKANEQKPLFRFDELSSCLNNKPSNTSHLLAEHIAGL